MPTSSSATYTTGGNQLATSSLASGLTYDAAGDITYDGNNAYLYDAEGRICASENGSGTMTGYIYDGAGIRVAKASLTTFSCAFASNGYHVTSSYVLGLGNEQVTEYSLSGSAQTWVHTNAFAAGKLLASYHDTDTYFALEDWLGTKRMEITPDGLTATFRSLPYGNGLVSSGTAIDATEQHFTGKERDAESGNDYFEARYYSSNLGRFKSPDWSAKAAPVPYARMDNPQTLNLYVYLRNDPLAGVDADGHCGQQQTGSSGCPDVHVSAVKDGDPNVMHNSPPNPGLVKVGTTVTIKVTDGSGKGIAGAAVKETPTEHDNITGKPVDAKANPNPVHTAADGTTPKDVVATNVIKEGDATDQEVKEQVNGRPYDRTITQNLSITTTGSGGQTCTCTATYTEHVTNVAAGGLTSPNPETGVNRAITISPVQVTPNSPQQ